MKTIVESNGGTKIIGTGEAPTDVGNISTEWSTDKNMLDGKLPKWETVQELQNNVNAWCFINYFFLPSVVGKCMWVTSIQQGAKLRSLTTPSDEAFCLLVLNKNWNLWAWECHNPGTTIAFKKANAPHRTVEFGGWNQDGITLYNTLVEELTI